MQSGKDQKRLTDSQHRQRHGYTLPNQLSHSIPSMSTFPPKLLYNDSSTGTEKCHVSNSRIRSIYRTIRDMPQGSQESLCLKKFSSLWAWETPGIYRGCRGNWNEPWMAAWTCDSEWKCLFVIVFSHSLVFSFSIWPGVQGSSIPEWIVYDSYDSRFVAGELPM